MSVIENAKRKASETAVEEWLKNRQVIGIGSGTTIEYAVEYVRHDGLCAFSEALELLVKHKLEITSLDVHKVLDVAFDGADEVCENLMLIKGGGGCLLQEKIVAASATDFIVLADERKCSKKLGTQWTKGLPIEVVPMALRPVQMWIEKRLGGKAILRPAGTKMGPQLTDNGNFLLDWQFDSAVDYDWAKVEVDLLRMPGVVDTGLFIDMARKVYIGNLDGSIKTWGT
ncbi:hypothetical protein P879_00781 [Paragonimus westermani]|uniref:ribose-5-phosphate isomerase n=1 Tax=Paragonimus westermani TaxID=34504 RepID=A0A8T0D4G4_9TREM|nr:hypothetical protein P879_00781 [Paragonimus westermani]